MCPRTAASLDRKTDAPRCSNAGVSAKIDLCAEKLVHMSSRDDVLVEWKYSRVAARPILSAHGAECRIWGAAEAQDRPSMSPRGSS